MENYVRNCTIKRRVNDAADVLFLENGDGTITVKLDGYAIMPREEYEVLKAGEPRPTIQDMKDEVDRLLKEAWEANSHITLGEFVELYKNRLHMTLL